METVTAKAPAPAHGENQLPAFSVAQIAKAAASAAAAGPAVQQSSSSSNPLPNTPPVRSNTGGKAPRSRHGSLERTLSDSSSRTASLGKDSDVEHQKAKKRQRKEEKKKKSKKSSKRRREESDSGSQSSDEESEASESSRGALEEPRKPAKKKKKEAIPFILDGKTKSKYDMYKV